MRRRLALPLVLALGLLAPATASAQRLVAIDAPSRLVGATGAELKANVLLPDGYDRKKTYPLLLLLHGAGEHYDSWARPDRGDILTTARGLNAIVVMPEGQRGFYSNWWNGGQRGEPYGCAAGRAGCLLNGAAWERYFFEELIPLIERRYPIRAGRRWHAIAGFSMAGFGTAFLASQRPGYFGTAAPLSGFVSVQRDVNDFGLTLFSGVDYKSIFGPPQGFYAAGHNPVALAPNLEHTRMWVSTGNGIPRPGVEASLTDIVSGALELVLRDQNDEFVAALRRAGARVSYRVHLGNHSFPYWREDLKALIAEGLFPAVQSTPGKWTFKTVAQRSEAWGMRFVFARPPDRLITLRREGAELLAEGAGEVTVRDSRECVFTAGLPFRRLLSGKLCRRLRIHLAPNRLRPGETRRVRVTVTTVQAGRRVPAARATVRLGRRVRRTSAGGRTSFVVTAGPARRTLLVRAAKTGSRSTLARLRVR
jgi:S-formylglutathione hydrolase FrmB